MPLFFSTEEGARACQRNGWENYHLIRLDLEVFTDGWLPNMIQDGLYCGLNWDASLQGLELNPENVLEELEGERQSKHHFSGRTSGKVVFL
ncbi:hypothetical protein Exig_1292 [Exiguobacterium sibiricum 255-15]|uniref:DUF2750 domain-containing protein n=1 Tax=Exiguobacterium sibiricum (strain DSM 17290 / CCUG 55495 / CIP 109462 / JCM 13490 / 255-15) TaxID=262543 RepID=B1YF89_EXIS2|nr:hypothetical protein Exig_1292 [Exiguobacterium sibiricum 255-15]